MKIHLFSILLAFIAMGASAQTNAVEKVKATGDRVSLRAKPDINSEILDRAMKGEEFAFLGETNGWLAVQAPESLNFWVSGQYVQNGVVQPTKLNVRSGPGPSYSVVCVVKKDDTLSLRGEFGDWLKIAPPKGSRVWISAKYAQLIEPPKPEPAPEAVAEALPEVVIPAPEEEEALEPLVLVLDKTMKQGLYAEVPGVLRRANPGLYKLVRIDGDTEETICLVRGEQRQMEHFLNRAMLIKGKKYWAKDVAWPILQPSKIHLDPIISE